MRIILCVVWCCAWWYSPAHSMDDLGRVPLVVLNPNDCKEYWFEQDLDHFSPVNCETWSQRYLMNDKYYKKGGPVFLWLGDQVEIGHSFIHTGAWVEYAKEKNAFLFELEQRFYGTNLPTNNTCTENLVYLNSQQAVADSAQFIASMGKKYNFPPETKWVAFGASIGASLAAWLSVEYSHLVHVAVCSSSQLLAKVNHKEYFDTVEKILSAYSPECVSQIKQANRELNELLKTDEGAKQITKEFKLCDPLNKNNEKDVSSFFQNIAENIGSVVQYNKIVKDGLTYEGLCDTMVNNKLKNPLDRYAAVHSKILSYNNVSCLNYTYNKMIEYYSCTSWTCDAARGDRQAMYQTCAEFGGLQTSNELFGNRFNIDYLINACTDIFGKSFNLELLEGAVNRTNMVFGGLDIRAERVIFVEGLDNPYKSLGLTKPRTKHNKVIAIKGGAMASDIYPPSLTDTPQLQNARLAIKKYLSEYLAEDDLVHKH